MKPSRLTLSIAITSMIATSVIPAFGAEANEIIDPLPNTGYSKVTVEVKDTSGEGGTDPDNPDIPPDPTEIIVATVPVELPIIVGLDGSITVPTDAKIINHSSEKGIKISSIKVDMDSAWRAANFSDDFTTKEDNTKEIGLSFRGDTLSSDGTFKITDGNWDIGKQSELPLNMAVKLPKQTEVSKTQAATIGFTIDWSGKDSGSEVEKVTVEFITDGNGEIEGDTQIVVESGATPTFPKVRPASLRYELSSWVDSSTNIEITASTPITSDTVIKAVFSEKAASPKNWFTTDGANTITGLSAEYLDLVDAPTDLVIPNNIGGSTIKGIAANAFKGKDLITSIVIPKTVTEIGLDAFSGCTSLTELNLDYSQPCRIKNSPYGLSEETVVWGASEDWDTHPTSLVSLNKNSMTVIEVNGLINTIDKNVSGDIVIPTSVDGQKIAGIASGAFMGCKEITSVDIRPDTIIIYSDTFSGCSKLSKVTLPRSLTNIGSNAFYGCIALSGIYLPDNITKIDSGAFNGCRSLVSVTLPSSLKGINQDTFKECTSLISVGIPSSVTSISKNAFYNCTKISNLNIPNSVAGIAVDAFYNVPHITYNGTASGSPWGAKAIN